MARGLFDAEEIDLLRRAAKEDRELDENAFGRADGAGGSVRLSLWNHPGDEISYILDGESELLIDGEAPRRIKAGDAIVIKAGAVHDVRNTGKTPVRLIGVYVVEKGKPLATPAK